MVVTLCSILSANKTVLTVIIVVIMLVVFVVVFSGS